VTAEPGTRTGPGRLTRTLGRAVNSAVARFPSSWPLLRGPARRFFDSVAAGWDERVRSDSAEFLMSLRAALDRLPATPARILDIGTGTGAAAFELAARYPDAEGFDLIVMLNMPPFFDRVVALLRPAGFVLNTSSYGSRTPFFTPPGLLERGFERRGLRTIAAEQVGPGTYYLAERGRAAF
jgi:hypothetical protein